MVGILYKYEDGIPSGSALSYNTTTTSLLLGIFRQIRLLDIFINILSYQHSKVLQATHLRKGQSERDPSGCLLPGYRLAEWSTALIRDQPGALARYSTDLAFRWLWQKGTYNRTFLCTEPPYYAITTHFMA